MPNKNYQKGYYFERRVSKYLQKKYPLAKILRQGKSKFPDLWVIFSDGRIPMSVEVKWNKYLDKTEKILAKAIINKGFNFTVAYNDNRKIKFWDGNIKQNG